MSSAYHICILEDDAFFAGLYARKFEQRGWKTTVIEDVGALERCLDHHPDALIVDIESDAYKARDVVAAIKAPDSAHRSLPVIILTQASDWATVQRFMKLGVDAYLFKGHFVPSEVVEKIHRVLESRVV